MDISRRIVLPQVETRPRGRHTTFEERTQVRAYASLELDVHDIQKSLGWSVRTFRAILSVPETDRKIFD